MDNNVSVCSELCLKDETIVTLDAGLIADFIHAF